jgi:hypothetical protein
MNIKTPKLKWHRGQIAYFKKEEIAEILHTKKDKYKVVWTAYLGNTNYRSQNFDSLRQAQEYIRLLWNHYVSDIVTVFCDLTDN